MVMIARSETASLPRSLGEPHRSRAVRAGAILGLLLAFGATVRAAAPEDITGLWLTDDGEGAIEIRPCGEQRCGRIAWSKNPNGPDGRVAVDSNNPDPSLRTRPICGIQIISGLKPQSDGSWGEGRVYNPENGKTYDMEIRRQTTDSVKVTGYMGLKILGQTMDWHRAPKTLALCTATGARPAARP